MNYSSNATRDNAKNVRKGMRKKKGNFDDLIFALLIPTLYVININLIVTQLMRTENVE